MIYLRKASERGIFDHGWLKSAHTFSFAEYYDPHFMGFGHLRVINEDYISPTRGFPTHPHKNMEIITFVISGELSHRDSMGNSSKILPYELQYMNAGTGITHSEYNSSDKNELHLYQIWVIPPENKNETSYQQSNVKEKIKDQTLTLCATFDSEKFQENIIKLHQKMNIYFGQGQQEQIIHLSELLSNQKSKIWIQLISGEMHINDIQAKSSDGIAIDNDHSKIQLHMTQNSEYLIFEMFE